METGYMYLLGITTLIAFLGVMAIAEAIKVIAIHGKKEDEKKASMN